MGPVSIPLDRRDERSYPPEAQGPVVVCDVDRTYLATRFSSLRGLARIPLEFAVDKEVIRGMPALLRELRRGPLARSRHTPLYFVSASPPQLRPVLERRMLLDGVESDGTTFKDWGAALRSLRPGQIVDQLGFKLAALLEGRRCLPQGLSEILIGDDLESDPLAYLLYADAVAGRISPAELGLVLRARKVAPPDVEEILRRLRQLPRCEAVDRVYLRVERGGTPELYLDHWPRLVPCSDAFQMGAALLQDARISRPGLVRVAAQQRDAGASEAVLLRRLQDAARRSLLRPAHAAEVAQDLCDAGLLSHLPALPPPDRAWAARLERDPSLPWTPRRLRGLA